LLIRSTSAAQTAKPSKRTIAYIQDHFAREALRAAIEGRPKHIYSIYRKMDRKNLPFSQIYDIRAIRIIVSTIPECYQALGIIHNIYHAIPGEFDDYISAPKDNSYRSLHTAVLDQEGKTLEIQIRTHEMNEEAEYGIAAHWRYKENRASTAAEAAFERRLERIRRMMEVAQESEDEGESFVQDMLDQISPERIYAFTPKGDIVDLPEGATPIDFAYHIHTEVGHRCRGAKVDGRLVSLDYQLKNGDQIEIITANRGGPSLDWLNTDLGYITTPRARTKVKQWFRRRERDKNIAAGKEALDRELRKIGLAALSRDEVASQFGYAHAEDFMAAIGSGDITASQISLRLLEAERKPGDEKLEPTIQRAAGPVRAEGMRIDETGGLRHAARWFNPSNDITGFIRGKGITVHRADCKYPPPPSRAIINVTWPPANGQSLPVPVLIVAYDREGLMRDIGAVIADENINMSNVNISTRQNIATFELTLEIDDLTQLGRVLAKIEHLPNVIEAFRRTS
jgi:GTP pyrophosphokinase